MIFFRYILFVLGVKTFLSLLNSHNNSGNACAYWKVLLTTTCANLLAPLNSICVNLCTDIWLLGKNNLSLLAFCHR